MTLIRNHDERQIGPITSALLRLGRTVRLRLRSRFTRNPDLHEAEEGASDLQYPIDRLAESDLLAWVEEAFPREWGIRLLFEGGAPEGTIVRGGSPRHLVVLDPVDGTRGLMHDKRSAWFLAGVASDEGGPTLQRLTHACLLELPTSRSSLSDVLLFGDGRVSSWTENVDGTNSQPLLLRPSCAHDLLHGFATVNRFLWRDAAIWGSFQDRLLARLFPDAADAGRRVFEDQYISNGGQLHGLMTGRDRLVVDLRP
ncbi:MAG TPA: inositol monophosphatase family protein, partial [Planctomycetota bacterium]|nr:inositol monophosphatase family protein [Planctomycetota bacterium]